MHASAYAFFEERAANLPRSRFVVEVGGRDVNGAIRDLFPADRYLSIDLHPGPGVDLVADACEWRPPESPDLVLCAEVLEHAPDAAKMLACIHDWLTPGGVLILATVGGRWPPHSGYDGGLVRPGEFYRGVEAEDFGDWLRPFWQFTFKCEPNGDRFALGIKRPVEGCEAPVTIQSLWPEWEFVDVQGQSEVTA